MLDKELYGYFLRISKNKIQGKTFDEYFSIGKVPLRWFMHTIITSGTLPQKFFVSASRIKSREGFTLSEGIYFRFASYVFTVLLKFSEYVKYVFRHLYKR